jgi:hypothetical protein
VSSSGDSLPLLFGQVSVINSAIDPTAYSPRRDGITVRATTIANAVPALRVGSRFVSAGVSLLGATHFAISRDFWTYLGTNSFDQITVIGTSVNASGFGPGAGLTVSDAKVVGGNIACMAPTGFVDPGPITAYVPIYTQMPDSANAVIGFGQVQISPTGTITPIPGQIVPNATSLITGSPPCVDHFAEARAFEAANPTPGLIFAPVIVR